MAARATGTFDVRLNPQPADESGIGRLTIDKQFHGNLEGTSKGHMLAYSTEVQGSAGYVAMERVTGTVGGRSGSFVLQHSATMTRGEPLLVLTVVPDSEPPRSQTSQARWPSPSSTRNTSTSSSTRFPT
jgi:Protein of unknown function (DUF3224)